MKIPKEPTGMLSLYYYQYKEAWAKSCLAKNGISWSSDKELQLIAKTRLELRAYYNLRDYEFLLLDKKAIGFWDKIKIIGLPIDLDINEGGSDEEAKNN